MTDMSENNCECKCNSNPKELPVVIGGIVIYELAIIIVLLLLIFLNLDAPCEKFHSVNTEPGETKE